MSESLYIDINADVGEGLGNEDQLMPFLSSCSIACGGHAGNLETMTTVVKLAKKYNVKVGAHPSFPDKSNFGRVVLDMSAADLYTSLKRQINVFQAVLREENVMLHQIKPHGALYNLAAKDERTAKVIIEVVKSIALPVQLYVPYKSTIAELAKKEGVKIMYEAFADRNYNTDLSLVSRNEKHAIIESKDEVLNHLIMMVRHHCVKTIQDQIVPIEASTFCIHGDTKNAIEIVSHLNNELPKQSIFIQ
jgi:UPF0271 protein